MSSESTSSYSTYHDEDTDPFIKRASTDIMEDEKFGIRSRPWYLRIMKPVILISLLILAFFLFATLLLDNKSGEVPNAPKTQHKGGSKVLAHCGTNPEEAQAQGCIWDIMSFGWAHPTCFDKEESDKWYEQYGPWEWYAEKPGNETEQIPLTTEQLPYTPLVWATQGYHIQHCLYVLKLIHLAGLNSAPVTNEGIEVGHTEHCIKLIGNPKITPYDQVNTRVRLLFVQCVTLT